MHESQQPTSGMTEMQPISAVTVIQPELEELSSKTESSLSDGSTSSVRKSAVSIVKGDVTFPRCVPHGGEALQTLGKNSSLLIDSEPEEVEVTGFWGVIKKDNWSKIQILFLLLCASLGLYLSVQQFINAHRHETAEMKPKRIDRARTYFQPESDNYEQPYYYFIFVANNVTNDSWSELVENHSILMELYLGVNTWDPNFSFMDWDRALNLAELYFRFPLPDEVIGKSQMEQWENNYYYYSYEEEDEEEDDWGFGWAQWKISYRMMHLFCGSLNDEDVTMGPINYDVWAEPSINDGEYIVVTRVQFDDFRSANLSYQPYCRFDIHTEDSFEFREAVDMRLIFFASHVDLAAGREDELNWYWYDQHELSFDYDMQGMPQRSENFKPTTLGGGTSWGYLQEHQSIAAWIEVPDDSVLHEYGQLIYYRMSETWTDGVKIVTANTDTWRHQDPDLIQIIVYPYPIVEEWGTYVVYGYMDAISSIGANWTLVTLVFFTVTRWFADRNEENNGVLPYVSKDDLVRVKLENLIKAASIHDYNLRFLKAGIHELNINQNTGSRRGLAVEL